MKLFTVLSALISSCAAVRETVSDHKVEEVADHSQSAHHEGRDWVWCPCTVCCQNGNSNINFTCLLEKGGSKSAPGDRGCGAVTEFGTYLQQTTCSFTEIEQDMTTASKLAKDCDVAAANFYADRVAKLERER